jgi:hypothetical protein
MYSIEKYKNNKRKSGKPCPKKNQDLQPANFTNLFVHKEVREILKKLKGEESYSVFLLQLINCYFDKNKSTE